MLSFLICFTQKLSHQVLKFYSLIIYFRTYLINIHKYPLLFFVSKINTILKLELLCLVKSLNLCYFNLCKINWRTKDNYPNKSTKNKVLQHFYVMHNEKDALYPNDTLLTNDTFSSLLEWSKNQAWYLDLRSTQQAK